MNATPEAARIMMEVIKAKNPSVGLPAGGVKDAAVAGQISGHGRKRSWARIQGSVPAPSASGASSLLASLLATLGHGDKPANTSGYRKRRQAVRRPLFRILFGLCSGDARRE